MFFFSSRRRHTRCSRDWSSDVCSSDLYSMPCYPALALLLGPSMAEGGHWIRRGTRGLSVVAGCAGIACIAIFFLVRNVPTPGDISSALGHHPDRKSTRLNSSHGYISYAVF